MINQTLPRLAGAALSRSLVLAALVAPLATLAADDAGSPTVAPAHGRAADRSQPTDGATDDGFDGEVVYRPVLHQPGPGRDARRVARSRAVQRTTATRR